MTRSDAYLVHLALVIAAAALIWRTRDAGRSRRARPWLAMAGLAAIVSFAVWSWGRATPFGDFDKAYFPAGRLVLSAPERLYLRHRHPLFREPPDRCGAVLPAVRAVSDPGPGCVHDGRRRRRLRNRLAVAQDGGGFGLACECPRGRPLPRTGPCITARGWETSATSCCCRWCWRSGTRERPRARQARGSQSSPRSSRRCCCSCPI